MPLKIDTFLPVISSRKPVILINNIFVALFFIILSSPAFCQQTFYTISGNISDEITSEPLENVNIKIQNSRIGTASDDLGFFKITTSRLPVILVISHIGYETKHISIKVQPLLELNIALKPETKQLEGVTISIKKPEIVYKDDKYSILDYEFLEDGILLLIFKSNLLRSELLYTDLEGKELSTLKILPGKPLSLFKDCLGNVHIFTKTRVFEIFFNNSTIKLYEAIDIEYFKSVMSTCRFQIKDKLYFQEKVFMELISNFYYVNTLNKKKFVLSTTGDQDKLDFFNDNPENFMLFGTGKAPDLGDFKGLPGDFKIDSIIRYIDVEARFRKMTFLSPAYIPVFRLGDTVCIFNHPGNIIEFYNYSDSLVNETAIDYHKTKKLNNLETLGYAFVKSTKWQEKIYIDEELKKAYTVFQNISGTKDLKEIDLDTGKLTHKLTIPFPYVQKIKIKNNYIYFIYKGWGETHRKKLFRQEIR